MFFQPPFDKQRLIPVLALCLILLAVLIAGGSIWALFAYTVSPSSRAALTPVASATSTFIPSSPATPTVEGTAQANNASSTSTAISSGSPNNNPVATPSGNTSTNSAAAGHTTITAAAPTPTPKLSTTIGATSPSLLYGTNLSLQNASDQALNGYVAPLLAQMHVGMVRIPMRAGIPQSTYLQAAQMTKSINAIPLVILETPEVVASALNDDAQIIATMNSLFGSGVYYEYGNEPDLNTNDPAPYIASWNRNVPDLMKQTKGGRLVGPSTYYANFDYIESFLKGAKPTPSYLSWHEYTCDASWDASICISHIDNWTTHISKIRSIMKDTLDTTLPIIISEWNYTPAHTVTGDGKHDNATFMKEWTTRALQVLANNQVYAAMQYACAGTQVPLVDASNHITTQGSVFQQMG